MKNASTIILSALILGVMGDFLFHDSVFGNIPIGISLLIMISALTVNALILALKTKWPAQWRSLWLMVPPLLLAIGTVWRDSAVLTWLDVSILLFFLCASSLSMQGLKFLSSGLLSYFNTLWCAIEGAVFKPFDLLFKEMQWNIVLSQRAREQARAVSKGVMIALPLLLVFGGLFIAADAAFEGLVRKSFQFDLGNSASHLWLSIVFFWCAAGFLHGMFNGKFEREALEPDLLTEKTKHFSLGLVEVGVILGSLNLLFLAFVLVQARYFFGGANLVEVTSGLTYAEYARRGFFELVTVVTLVLPILLGLDWLLEKTTALRVWLFRSLTAVQIGLLFVIMVSAVQRMRLYQFEYGMTELRLYTTAFMGWLAVVCVIFVATVLRGKRDRFAFASVMSGFAVVLGLHAMNPDAYIVQSNIAHAQAGKSFDADYALLLSSDAVPALVDRMAVLPAVTREKLANGLAARYKEAPGDWRGWNWSRSQALDAVKNRLGRSEKSKEVDRKVSSIDLRMKPRG